MGSTEINSLLQQQTDVPRQRKASSLKRYEPNLGVALFSQTHGRSDDQSLDRLQSVYAWSSISMLRNVRPVPLVTNLRSIYPTLAPPPPPPPPPPPLLLHCARGHWAMHEPGSAGPCPATGLLRGAADTPLRFSRQRNALNLALVSVLSPVCVCVCVCLCVCVCVCLCASVCVWILGAGDQKVRYNYSLSLSLSL